MNRDRRCCYREGNIKREGAPVRTTVGRLRQTLHGCRIKRLRVGRVHGDHIDGRVRQAEAAVGECLPAIRAAVYALALGSDVNGVRIGQKPVVDCGGDSESRVEVTAAIVADCAGNAVEQGLETVRGQFSRCRHQCKID